MIRLDAVGTTRMGVRLGHVVWMCQHVGPALGKYLWVGVNKIQGPYSQSDLLCTPYYVCTEYSLVTGQWSWSLLPDIILLQDSAMCSLILGKRVPAEYSDIVDGGRRTEYIPGTSLDHVGPVQCNCWFSPICQAPSYYVRSSGSGSTPRNAGVTMLVGHPWVFSGVQGPPTAVLEPRTVWLINSGPRNVS